MYELLALHINREDYICLNKKKIDYTRYHEQDVRLQIQK